VEEVASYVILCKLLLEIYGTNIDLKENIYGGNPSKFAVAMLYV
jgi:hypothetical protein